MLEGSAHPADDFLASIIPAELAFSYFLNDFHLTMTVLDSLHQLGT